MDFCNRSNYDLRSVLKIALPLVLSSLVMTLMMSVDRFVMSLFSVTSMNALSSVSSYVGIPILFFIAIASVSTVFVGQYNGRCELQKVGQPVWQMIYFSIIAAVVCIPFSLYPDLICPLPELYYDEGIKYQSIITAFIWESPMYSAIAGFFIGRGKTLVITAIAMLSNILNLILDIILVFGVKGFVPSMGISGAAIATGISQFVAILVLFCMFLSRRNREVYRTHDCSFIKETFVQCCKIGFPTAIDRVFNLTAWSIVVLLLGRVSDDLATLESVTFVVYLVLCCYTNGMDKSAASITANLIGENKMGDIHRIFKIYMKINLFFCFIVAIPLVFHQDILFYFLGKMNGDISHLYQEFSFVFYLLFIIIFLDGIAWTLAGILMGGGDTLWPAIINTLLVWGIIVGPVYYMYINHTLNSVKEMNMLSAITSLLTAILLYVRYRKGDKLKKVIS